MMSSQRAAALGLVSMVVPHDGLDETVTREVKTALCTCSPWCHGTGQADDARHYRT